MARILDVCDAAVALIAAAWSPAAPDGASRIYAKDIALQKSAGATLLAGRQVYVFPKANQLDSVIDARTKLNKYSFGIVIAERYADGPGPVPDAWMDARVDFVEQSILKTLSDLTVRLSGAWIDPRRLQGIDGVYDRDEMQKRLAFWSTCSFTFQDTGV